MRLLTVDAWHFRRLLTAQELVDRTAGSGAPSADNLQATTNLRRFGLRLLQDEVDQLAALEEGRRDLVAFAGDELHRDRAAGGFVTLLQELRVLRIRHRAI